MIIQLVCGERFTFTVFFLLLVPYQYYFVMRSVCLRIVEQTLMKIWAEVLQVEQVGINDNFFELGGDSILGTLMLARAAQAGVKLSPRRLFEPPDHYRTF